LELLTLHTTGLEVRCIRCINNVELHCEGSYVLTWVLQICLQSQHMIKMRIRHVLA